jgi:hypothetical protein
MTDNYTLNALLAYLETAEVCFLDLLKPLDITDIDRAFKTAFFNALGLLESSEVSSAVLLRRYGAFPAFLRFL